MGRKKKSVDATETATKPKRAKKTKEPKMLDEDDTSQISILINLNEEANIDDIQAPAIDESGQQYELLEVDDDQAPPELEVAESGTLAEEDPELVITNEGSVLIAYKDETIVEHVCAKCNKSFRSIKTLKKHLPSCRSPVVISIPAEPVFVKPKTPEIDMSEIEEELRKDKPPKTVKNPNFEKYCNPRPSHPCYCCDEDVSTAHSGHIRCRQCPKSFKTNNSFRKHMNSVHTGDFECETCNAKCPTQEIFDLHMKTHTSSGKPFACGVCGKDFTRKYHLDRHALHSRCKGSEPQVKKLACEVCNKEFSRVDNLREHLRGHMGTGVRKRDYQCPYCPKSFFGSSLLNIHIRSHTGEKPFPCDLCAKSFPSNGALRKHYRTHTGEKPYECKVCQARFSAKETLNRHMKTHTGVKPHKCDQCPAAFIQMTQLKAHRFQHTGIKEHNCDQCELSFSRKVLLTEHKKYDHEGHKPFQCKYCEKTYKRKDDFIRHWKNHKGIKSYTCDVCSKGFSLKASLKLHQRTHLLSAPVDCLECGKRFIRNDCLERHRRQKHPNSEDVIFEIVTVGGDPSNPGDDNIALVQSSKGKSGVAIHIPIDETAVVGEADAGDRITISLNNESVDKQQESVKAEPEPVKVIAPVGQEAEEGEVMMSQMFTDAPVFMDDDTLKARIYDLLLMLVDEETLTELGWPDTEVDELLSAIIKNCGHDPLGQDDDDTVDEPTRLRENTKLLFTLVIENDDVKSLLNNYTLDEVIHYVLKIGKI